MILVLFFLFYIISLKQRDTSDPRWSIYKQTSPLTAAEDDLLHSLTFRISENNLTRRSPSSKKHIVFVKVHKAASSTMHNIFTRFALLNNLNVMINTQDPHINELGYQINENVLVPRPCGSTFDLLCNHLIFNHSEISPYFPKDTVYVGIVREPFSQFLSAFIYYSYVWPQEINSKVIKKNPENPIEEFLENSESFLKGTRQNQVMIDNRMSVDFGFPLDDFQNSKSNLSKISEFVQSLDKRFDFVLIVEYFDESLVMLRRILNWSTKDIIYVKNNVKKANDNHLPFVNRKTYPDDVTKKFAQFARLDLAVYKHFHAVFQRKLLAQPPDFHSEVDAFRSVREKVAEMCSGLLAHRNLAKVLTVPGTQFTTSFLLTSLDCVLLTDEETILTGRAARVQLTRANQLRCAH